MSNIIDRLRELNEDILDPTCDCAICRKARDEIARLRACLTPRQRGEEVSDMLTVVLQTSKDDHEDGHTYVNLITAEGYQWELEYPFDNIEEVAEFHEDLGRAIRQAYAVRCAALEHALAQATE